MYIPETWEHRQFDEWNLLVKGLMEVWNCAEALGAEECLDWHLDIDADGRLAELLSYMGRHEVGLLRPVNSQPRDNGNRNEGHSRNEDGVEAYLQSTRNGERPTEQAYAGAQLVRDFLLRVEQFAEEKGLGTRDLRRILCEAMCVYSESQELPRALPLSS